MHNFSGFSEAARLYAENIPIIEAMSQKMHESITEFVDCLGEKLAQALAPIRIEADKKWSREQHWCSFAPVSHSLPYVAFDQRPRTIVDPGELLFYVCGPWKATTDRDVRRVTAMAQSPELQRFGLSPSAIDWAILEAKISFGSANPVEVVGTAFATILRQIATTYQEA